MDAESPLSAPKLLVPMNNAADLELASNFDAIFEEYVHYQNLQDIPGILNCLHLASPNLPVMEKSLQDLFDHYTLQISIIDRVWVGYDGLYAYYRFRQRIEKIAGPEFRDMEAENLIVFRQQDEVWKIWNYLSLWVQPL